jgi:hypothetical protein
MRVTAKNGGELFGWEIPREEFIKLDPGKVYDDIVRAGFGGAPGVVLRREDGTISVEDWHAVCTTEDPPPILRLVHRFRDAARIVAMGGFSFSP